MLHLLILIKSLQTVLFRGELYSFYVGIHKASLQIILWVFIFIVFPLWILCSFLRLLWLTRVELQRVFYKRILRPFCSTRFSSFWAEMRNTVLPPASSHTYDFGNDLNSLLECASMSLFQLWDWTIVTQFNYALL